MYLKDVKQLLIVDIQASINLCKDIFKANRINLLIVFCVYLVGAFSLIIANFNYIDDIDRSLFGYFGFNDWSRYSATFISATLQLNSEFLLNIAPYSLFLALFILSLSSLMLLYAIDEKLLNSKVALLASVGIGLFPYYLENLSYKFDCVFMAVSVFSAIFPFIFVRFSKVFFCLISIISLLIVFTTYQASNGIYIILSIFLIYRNIINAHFVSAWHMALFGALSFIIAVLIFKFLIYTPLYTYANNGILPLEYMVIGAYKHLRDYIMLIYSDFHTTILFVLMLGFALIFIIKSMQCKINKLLALLCGIVGLMTMCIFAFGLYIFLIMPLYTPRAFIGFGVFITIIAIYSISMQTWFLKITSTILIIVFVEHLIVFSNYYGYALRAQENYEFFRISNIANDLSKVIDASHLNPNTRINVAFKGSTGDTPMLNISKMYYPLIERLVPRTISETSYLATLRLVEFGIPAMWDKDYCGDSRLIDTSNTKDLKLVADNYYHSIFMFQQGISTCFVVNLKPIYTMGGVIESFSLIILICIDLLKIYNRLFIKVKHLIYTKV